MATIGAVVRPTIQGLVAHLTMTKIEIPPMMDHRTTIGVAADTAVTGEDQDRVAAHHIATGAAVNLAMIVVDQGHTVTGAVDDLATNGVDQHAETIAVDPEDRPAEMIEAAPAAAMWVAAASR